MTVLQAAHKILSRLGEAHYKDIAREIKERGLARLAGRTPETTVYAVISADMKHNGVKSDFIRVKPGVFALRDTGPSPSGSNASHDADQGEATHNVPTEDDLLWPTLRALESLGGSATISEILPQLVKSLALPASVLGVPHGGGPRSEVEYRASWARTHLKRIGAVVNQSRGVWAITPEGRDIESDKRLRELVHEPRQDRRPKLPESSTSRPADEDWKQALLRVLGRMKPDAFERLCQRILRESGFVKVKVTGRSGDGGIDGVGVLRVNLLSFHVAFQCKRYAGTVGPGEIRNFRGALVGRADRGLVMTTGRFTASATSEAVRDGALAIDLLDGDDLCELIKKYRVGTRVETVERVLIDEDFFSRM